MKPFITDFNASTCRRDKKQSVANGIGGRGVALMHRGVGRVVGGCALLSEQSGSCKNKQKRQRNENT